MDERPTLRKLIIVESKRSLIELKRNVTVVCESSM